MWNTFRGWFKKLLQCFSASKDRARAERESTPGSQVSAKFWQGVEAGDSGTLVTWRAAQVRGESHKKLSSNQPGTTGYPR